MRHHHDNPQAKPFHQLPNLILHDTLSLRSIFHFLCVSLRSPHPFRPHGNKTKATASKDENIRWHWEKKGRNLQVLFSFFLLFYYYYYNDTIGKGGDDVLTTGSRRSVKTPEAERVSPIPRSEKRAENCETDEDRSAA